MTTSNTMRKSEVGELRPSQVLTTFGIGSLVDLPNLSVMVMGLESWPDSYCTEIGEERLLASAQKVLGPQLKRLLAAPRGPETTRAQSNWFDESRQIGVPVAPFPRWLVCSKCRLLAPLSSGLFEPKVFAYRPDKACFVHACTTQGRAPMAVPARFLVACNKGHLDDFPWAEFAHRNTDCPEGSPLLRLYEVGASGEAADVEVKCDKCKASRRMAEAFGRDNQQHMPACRGRRPHLRDIDPKGCDVPHVQPILQGASNSWFGVMISALSVPQATDKLAQLVDENWTVLEKAQSREVVAAFRAIGQLKDFGKYTDEDIWHAVEKKRQGGDQGTDEPSDLKSPEWAVFSEPSSAQESKFFKLRPVDPPDDFLKYFEKIVLVEKLREVRALIGFTRIESPRDFDSPLEVPPERRMRLSRRDPTWIPASETRGEGIFFQFSEKAIEKWVTKTKKYDAEFFEGHKKWRASKNLPNPESGYPGLRFILLHTFAHAVLRQLAVECGYTTASISERIYSRSPADGEPMAGVLIYTSAPDSEGTLGGLCALGQPNKLGRHLHQAFDKMGLCASDPLCAEYDPGSGDNLHGAACHACSFLPETCCERGNKYLDRSVLVKTLARIAHRAFASRASRTI
jgi:hypothetical protein